MSYLPGTGRSKGFLTAEEITEIDRMWEEVEQDRAAALVQTPGLAESRRMILRRDRLLAALRSQWPRVSHQLRSLREAKELRRALTRAAKDAPRGLGYTGA